MNGIACNFVAGEDRFDDRGDTFDVLNPGTGKPVWKACSASPRDCDDAVTAAAAFQPTWEKVPPSQKRNILLKAADLLQTPKYSEKIRSCYAKETDASPIWIFFTTMAAVGYLREAASQASQIRGETVKSEKPDMDLLLTQRRAAGVVFGIAPWNAPIPLSLRAIVFALVAGNTVILKASEVSPATQRIVLDLMLEAGLPPLAMSFLVFSRETAPGLTSQIIARKEVRRVSFTGSDTVGRNIAAQCGQHLKPCILELGGKAPVIVSQHAKDNLDSAVKGIIYGALIHSGQVCMSTERVLVHRDLYEEFKALLVERVKDVKASDEAAPAKLAALFSQSSAQNVIRQVEDALEHGAKLLVGQGKAEGQNNTVIQPVVLAGVTQKMSLWSRESFGPVISLTPYDSMEEAIALANDSDYSLSAGLWTSNLHEAMTFAPQIRAATVQVNGATVYVETSVGNAGLGGASGFGRFNIDAFTDVRTIAFHAKNGNFPSF